MNTEKSIEGRRMRMKRCH